MLQLGAVLITSVYFQYLRPPRCARGADNYPKRLINEIEEHRYIIEDNDEDATASHLISQTSSDVAEGPPIIEDSDEEVFAHLHLYNA